MHSIKTLYWNSNGAFQSLCDILSAQIPAQGPAELNLVEQFRVISNIYYDFYNNGGVNFCTMQEEFEALSRTAHFIFATDAFERLIKTLDILDTENPFRVDLERASDLVIEYETEQGREVARALEDIVDSFLEMNQEKIMELHLKDMQEKASRENNQHKGAFAALSLLQIVYVRFPSEINPGDVLRDDSSNTILGQILGNVSENSFVAEMLTTFEARFAFVMSYIAHDGVNHDFLDIMIRAQIIEDIFEEDVPSFTLASLQPRDVTGDELNRALEIVLKKRENAAFSTSSSLL